MAGAVAGAVLLVLIHGTWLLIPFGILAVLLPFGRSRNYGLLSAFLTPLVVVVLIDLLSPAGWRLAEDRLIDTPPRTRPGSATYPAEIDGRAGGTRTRDLVHPKHAR